MTLLFGGPGCGKTVLALQCLVHGAARLNEPGNLCGLRGELAPDCRQRRFVGWDLARLQGASSSSSMRACSPAWFRAGQFELTGLLSSLEVKVRELGAKRIVFDGVDVPLTLPEDPAAERAELYRIAGVAAPARADGASVTAKALGADPFALLHYAFAAYMADCAILLERRHVGVVSRREIRSSSIAARRSSRTRRRSSSDRAASRWLSSRCSIP